MKHIWVELQYTPIEPKLLSDGTIEVYAREAALTVAYEDATQGCWACSAPLNRETIDDECPGGKDE